MEMRSLVTVRELASKFQYNKGGFPGWQPSFARNCPATSECWNRLKKPARGYTPPPICMNIKRKGFLEKEKREQAPALETQFYMRLSIAAGIGESRKTLGKSSRIAWFSSG